MGKDLYENSQAAKLVFEEASEGAGLDVAKLCFESDKATLSRTENSQIAIFTHSMAAWAALKEAGVEFKAAAGFSLGEYTALAAAGVVSLADGVKIVSMRGKLMQQAADSIDGGMAAILGLEDSVIEEACAKVTSGVVRPVTTTARVSWLSQVKRRLSQRRSKTARLQAHAVRSRLRYPVHSTPR